MEINFNFYKGFVILICLFSAKAVFAQNVGISTSSGFTPDASAGLDVSYTNKGLLVPRVALTATNAAGPIASPAVSLLIYNTTTAGTSPNNVVPGYYYWNGLAWNSLVSGTQTTNYAWALTGNTGTSYPTNFLGTKDNNGLHFITNSLHRFQIDTLGSVAVGLNPIFSTGIAREKFLVDAGSTTNNQTPAGAFNLIAGRGYLDNYLQLNIQNNSPTANASTDIVASNDAATETANFIDMGINSSANNTTGAIGGPGTAYLYGTGNDMAIGNGTPNKSLIFFTGGISPSTYTERIRLDASGRVGIGTNAPTSDLTLFQSSGTGGTKGFRFAGNSIGAVNSGTGFLMSLGYNSSGNKQLWLGDPDYSGNSTGTFVRFGVVNGSAAVFDAVSGDNSVRRYLALGVAGDSNSGVIFGNDFNPAAPGSMVWANGNMAIGNGYRANAAPTNGLIVQNNVGIGNTAPTEKLDVTGNLKFSGALMPNNTAGTVGYFLVSQGAGVAPIWYNANAYINTAAWILAGNPGTNPSTNFIGTTDAIDFVSRTNNIERFRITSAGNVGIGTTTPAQKLDVNGSINAATSLISQGSVFVDYAISNTGSKLPGIIFGGPNSGEGISSKRTSGGNVFGLDFYTNNVNEMSITQAGNVGIGTTAPSTKLHVFGANPLTLSGVVTGTSTSADSLLTITSGLVRKLPISTFTSSGTTWQTTGNAGTTAGTNFIGTSDAVDFVIKSNNTERARFSSTGNVSIGGTAFDPSNPEKLLVDAGTTSSINVISGRGTTNNYLQLNVQNKSTGNNASSDVVATNDTGNEANGLNFIDMGVNSSGYSTANSSILNGISNTYLYSSGNDMLIGNSTATKSLILFTGGTAASSERMRIDGSGNIGINNTAPTEKLDVAGNLKFSGALMPNNNAGTAGYILQSAGVGAPPVWVSSGASQAWGLTGNTGTTAGTNFIGTTDAIDFVTKTNNIEKVRVTSAGNLGIGTTTPSQKLDVNGTIISSTTTAYPNYAYNSANRIIFGEPNPPTNETGSVIQLASGSSTRNMVVALGKTGVNSSFLANDGSQTMIGVEGTANPITFRTGMVYTAASIIASGAEVMRITNAGNVGIGTTTPTQKLDVTGNINTSGSIYLDAASANTGVFGPGLYFGGSTSGEAISSRRTQGTNVYGLDFYTSSTNRMTIASGGNVGIGTNTPAYKFTVAGIVAPTVDNTYSLGGSTTNRWTYLYATNGAIQTSDRRLKTNIKPLNYGLKEVLALKPVSYNWKEKPGSDPKIGLIAQDVRKVVPEVVIGDETKEKLGMNYAELVPVLINAIKEQQKEIDDLKKQVQKIQK